MFLAAWESSFKQETILKAFEATGLSPLNSEVLLKRFGRQPTPGSSSDSDSSALRASKWRKIESLLREVVKDRRDPRAEKLSQAFRQISVRKSLVERDYAGSEARPYL
jgi:hypothetical protein